MLELLNVNEFDEMYSIMEDSFHNDEFRPRDEQIKLFKNKDYNVFVVKDTDKNIVAFIAVWNFEDFLFVEHFAVDKNNRNNGIGSIILRELKDITNKMICLEVEPPQNEITKRRVQFYRRNGFYLNEYPYIQPPISKGKKPVPLMIMTNDHKVDYNCFKLIKEYIYKNVYKVYTV